MMAGMAVVIIAVMVVNQVWQTYDVTVSTARRDIQQFTQILEANTDVTFQAVTLILDHAVEAALDNRANGQTHADLANRFITIADEVSLSVREILASAGHSVVEAASGKEAIKSLRAAEFDVIVSDIWMPEMDGIELLKEIRGAGNEIPVVVISGGAPNAPLTYTAPLAATFGANIVVYKPFEKAELLNAIAAVLGD